MIVDVPKHQRTFRFDSLAYDFVARQAMVSGVSVNDFVVGAALVRAALVLAADDPSNSSEMLRLYEEASVVLTRLGT